MRTFRVGSSDIHPPNLALTFLIGAVGGGLAMALHLPLGMLLGSLMAVGAAAIGGVKPAGRMIAVPQWLRFFFVPVIGVAIGSKFTPEVFAEAAGWGASLIGLMIYIPLAHLAGFALYRRIGRLDPATAWFGAVPGGLIESVALGEEAGADPRMLTILQFLRLILCIILVPLGFTWLTGHAVGSSGGASLSGPAPMGWPDVPVLLAAAVLGVWAGRLVRLPAAIITGPTLLSAAAHLAGLSDAAPPDWTVTATQLVVGTSLGARFSGMTRANFSTALRLAGLNTIIALTLAFLASAILHELVGERIGAVFLAYAPGGLTEMGLIALSLNISVIYVIAHHVLRILYSVTFARVFWPVMGRNSAEE